MHVTNLKLALSAVFILAVFAGISVTGFTTPVTEGEGGMMIDFGYYDVDWTRDAFDQDDTAVTALESVCALKGYELLFGPDGSVTSIDGRDNLQRGVEWGFFILGSDGGWNKVSDPSSFTLEDQKIGCWARSSEPSEIMPAADASGFIYYDYAEGGKVGGNDVRIVTMSASITETVAAIGCAEYIVGTTDDSGYVFSLKGVDATGGCASVGSSTIPNYEKIVSVSPDLVFLDGTLEIHRNFADKLRKSGVDCVLLYGYDDLGNVFRDIWMCASAVGFSERGNSYMVEMNTSVTRVANIFSESGRVFVAHSNSPATFTSGKGTFMDNLLSSLDLANIFSAEGTYEVTAEEVFTSQPDAVVMVLSNVCIDSERGYRNILNSLPDLWKDTPAYREGRVYIFSGDSAKLMDVPGPRMSSALELLAKVIDQDSFRKVFPSDKVFNYFGDSYRDFLVYQTGGLLE